MINQCINKRTSLFDAISNGDFTVEEQAQITAKLNQESFIKWYGEGEVDSLGQPKLVDEIYLVNDKRVKITLRDLINDDLWEKRQNYSKDLTSLDKIKKFLEDSDVDIAKRISAFKDTDYADKLQRLLDYLNTLEDNEHLKGLIAHYEYMFKTTNDFELRFREYDINKGVRADRSKDKAFKTFLTHANNFLQSFSKVKNLDSPVIETSEEREIIEKLKALDTRIKELSQRVNTEIEGVTRDVLDEFISNPEVKKGVIDFLAAQTDESKVQLLLDALGDSHVTFLAGIDKFFKKAMYDRDEKTKELFREWDKLVKDLGGKDAFNSYLRDKLIMKDGSGRLVQKYSDAYYDKIFDYRSRLNKLEEDNKQDTKEYIDLLGEYYTWKKDNTQQKYIKKYYDALNLLIPQARKAREEIDLAKTLILDKGVSELSIEDHEDIKALDSEMQWLKSLVNRDGTEKTGEDLAIANSLFRYSKAMSEFYYVKSINRKAFNKAEREAKEKGAEELEKWTLANTRETYTEAFWKTFREIMSRIPRSEDLEKVEEEIKQLTVGYKNDKGELKVDDIPKEVMDKLKVLQAKKSSIKSELNKSVPFKQIQDLAKDFKRYIKFQPTSEYLKVFAGKNEQLNSGEITQEEYDYWFNENHDIDPYTQDVEPISIWTKIRPRDPKFIIREPNKLWEVTDVKEEFKNPNFQEDKNGFPVPTDTWISKEYSNLSDKDKSNLSDIQNRLYYLTEHTKNDIIKRGYLPAIPNYDNRSNSKTKESFTDVAVTETDDIVKFIPFKYVKKLNQQALPELGSGATEEENKKIEEERKRIIKENRETHGNSIDYDFATNMKSFIRAALNHKYKSDIEVDLKLFREQMRHQKIKVTNTKGDKLHDKIKSALLGDKIEHEVTAVGSNTEEHFKKWLDAVFYEDFELDEGVLSNWANKIQNFTSLRALGFNVLSGMNNKLIGNIQGRIEAAGGIYYNYSDYRNARKTYTLNMLHFISNRKDEIGDNYIDGFIKKFDILISQDELSNKPTGKLQTILHKLRMVKDMAYFMQHIGEHQIQNAALLAMSNSHRIVNGKIVNFDEFWRDRKASIDFSKDMTSEELEAEIKKIDTNQEMKKVVGEEFDKFPRVVDSYELKDGLVKLKDGMILNENEVFNFRERVIGINQRLHGIYNTEDAAMIQRSALGRLAMQFRKWMRPGWNRRFGRRFGKEDYNERIRDYEEGMYISTFKYLFNPAIKNWKEFRKLEQKTAAKAFKMLFDSIKDTFTNARIRWHVLSEVEKAGVRRTALEFTFLISVICLGFLAKSLKGEGDDDDEKGLVLALYQADRLFGELTTFTPIGIVREGNRLFSSPSPVFNTLEDVLKLGRELFLYLFRDEEERKFKTGIYHGEDKIDIYLKDMIPVYNQLQRLDYMGEQNQRYGLFR